MRRIFPHHGVIVPLVTPLDGRDRLDEAGLERLVEHVVDGGVHGIFLLGTTGEAPSLSERLKRQLIQRVVKQVDRRVPILVGVTDTSLVDSLELASFSAEQQVDAIVAAPPPYFPLGQHDLVSCMTDLANESPLPVYLYNMPSHCKVAFEAEAVRQLAQVDGVAGIKDSSGQMLFFNQMIALAEERADFTVLMGPEELLAESVLMGGHGGVCGGANLAPQLYVELYEAAVSGDLALVHRLQHRVLRLASRLYTVGDPPSGYLTGLKCALECVGLCRARLAEPLSSLPADRRSRLEQHLRDLEFLTDTGRIESR
ncbi:MAG: dihydrodipicolinate synthase family protein [Planctomycetota bacterium]|nr:MAG: dihydrodipicolinate synthase family protein [Planctomycetota bacterium]REJ96652.1 MAG: dihydrodipicolinate synthase family protein [Planctomycetota bacterium]REK23275.1 MAG: dihydrodipicolinate synthase family protein [Planctomycetota bacterium]REK30803.1 MAG: dihydrodipicolinate synthase family protein [Planctomycetota bacterium]